jgi:hypothetical protein
MKNVAATSGHSVNFATLVFVLEIVREGSWAGSDNVLNFYARPPQATFVFNRKTNSLLQNTRSAPARKKKMRVYKNIFVFLPGLPYGLCVLRDKFSRYFGYAGSPRENVPRSSSERSALRATRPPLC